MGCREYIIMCFQNLEELIFSFIIWGDLGSGIKGQGRGRRDGGDIWRTGIRSELRV